MVKNNCSIFGGIGCGYESIDVGMPCIVFTVSDTYSYIDKNRLVHVD